MGFDPPFAEKFETTEWETHALANQATMAGSSLHANQMPMSCKYWLYSFKTGPKSYNVPFWTFYANTNPASSTIYYIQD